MRHPLAFRFVLLLSAALLLVACSRAAPVRLPPEPEPDPLAWGYLGVRVTQGSLKVSSVDPGTPAFKAGLQAEDELVSVGTLDKLITFDDVAEHISSFRPGSLMKVTVRRKGELMSFTVKLGVRPAELPPPPNKRRLKPLEEQP
jgi:predicted metalloprotease with PDZ domain